MKSEFKYGLVLLVLNAIPATEEPPDPTTAIGMQRMAGELTESLIEHWDVMATQQTKIPLLLLALPGFEPVVSAALMQPITRRFPPGLLETVQIPAIGPAAGPQGLFALLKVRQGVARWLNAHPFQAVAVKPFSNHGAIVGYSTVEHLSSKQPSLQKVVVTPQPAGDLRPLILEAVPYDGKLGPITGISERGPESRPTLLPSVVWQGRGYHPQPADWRATGTLYFHVPMTRVCLEQDQIGGLNQLDQWSMQPLVQAAQVGWQEQPALFEFALQELAAIFRYRQLECEPQRGLRGYRTLN